MRLGLFSNKKMVLAVLVSLLMSLSIVYAPGISDAFRSVHIGWEEWVVIVPLAMTSMLFNEGIKVYSRVRKGRR